MRKEKTIMAEQQKNNGVEILERGEIFFLYRPAVEEEKVKGLEDVQRFYMLLHPEGSRKPRLIIIGKKRLPPADKSGERFWGFVDEILQSDKQLREQFGPESYETKTRGERSVGSMRPVGMGEYQLVRHGNHTHLAYELALPEQPKDVQQDLGIARAASYIISVKNPNASSPRGVGLENEQRAELPKHLQERFKGRRFINAEPPELLDHEGVEILLISTDESLEELGIDLEASSEAIERDAKQVFEALRMEQSDEKEKALLRGEW